MTRRTITVHNYASYTAGCRCEVCRQAKADYMRARRAEARAVARKYTDPNPRKAGAASVAAGGRYVAHIERHGTRYGYEEKGCRCIECTLARTDSDRRYREGQAR